MNKLFHPTLYLACDWVSMRPLYQSFSRFFANHENVLQPYRFYKKKMYYIPSVFMMYSRLNWVMVLGKYIPSAAATFFLRHNLIVFRWEHDKANIYVAAYRLLRSSHSVSGKPYLTTDWIDLGWIRLPAWWALWLPWWPPDGCSNALMYLLIFAMNFYFCFFVAFCWK